MPLVLLSLSLVVATIGAFRAHSAQRSHRATAEALLGDYGTFAAWSYRQHLDKRLGIALHETLHPVTHPGLVDRPISPDSLQSAFLHSDGDCASLYADTDSPYWFRVAPDGTGLVVAGDSPPSADDERAWLAATVAEHARSIEEWNRPAALLHAERDGAARHIAYAAREHPDGSRYIYGYELVPDRYRPFFRQILEEERLLPGTLTRERASAELLAVELHDSAGRTLFASADADRAEPAGRDTLEDRFGGLVVRAAIRPEVAGQLIIGGLPGSRVPWMLLIFGLAGALALLAFSYLRRENRFARLRSDFVSSVSHELRTPLAQMRLFFETLRLGRFDTDDEREWIMDNVERETIRLTHLVDNVLHFSRVERRTLSAELERVEVAPELRGIVEGFLPLADSRDVSVDVRLRDGIFARLERESFQQVVLNLLDNALKYGPRGQTVTVSLDAPDDDVDDERVRIAVEDEGPGIAVGERDVIWEPYRRGERAVGGVAAGSGIGLAVVREIVALHGGSAWVEDVQRHGTGGGGGGGARFVVEIPRAAPAEAAATDAAAKDSTENDAATTEPAADDRTEAPLRPAV